MYRIGRACRSKAGPTEANFLQKVGPPRQRGAKQFLQVSVEHCAAAAARAARFVMQTSADGAGPYAT